MTKQTITEMQNKQDFVLRAYELFDSFSMRSAAYRQKCNENEEFYRSNHWAGQRKRERGEPQPVTPVLFSTIESLLSDLMDAYPEAVLLGEEASDDAAAEELTALLSSALRRQNYRKIYRHKCRQALKNGASVQEILWDPDLAGGLGDVRIRDRDIRSFVWDPAFANIQDGRAVFTCNYYPMDWYRLHYPDKWEEIRLDTYRRDTPVWVDREDSILLLEMWYKDFKQGQTHVHMARFAGGVLLEDSRELRPEGMYAHGLYPFVVEPLFPLEGQPVGLGLIDILKDLQLYADKMDQIMLKNALLSSHPKMLINRSADMEEENLLDWEQEVVHGNRIDENAVRWLQTAPLPGYLIHHQLGKIDAIKEHSGQTQFNRGESMNGVTAASAILALQEAGNKRSRMLIDQLYDGFSELVRQVVALILENYTESRVARVRNGGFSREISYQTAHFDKQLEFDIRIEVQKQQAYRTLYQNELALQLLNSGVLDADLALEMLQFEGKDRLLEKRRILREAQDGEQNRLDA